MEDGRRAGDDASSDHDGRLGRRRFRNEDYEDENSDDAVDRRSRLLFSEYCFGGILEKRARLHGSPNGSRADGSEGGKAVLSAEK